jgi:UDPglucose 6-dehydrogenase
MKISIVGGGYVGLVSAACFAELGHSVNLIEIDGEKVEAINSARPLIYERGLEELLKVHAGRSLVATASYKDLDRSEITMICVGTPPRRDGEADLSMVASASRSIGEELMDGKGQHVVAVKSTVPPGTTELLVRPAVLESSCRDPEEIGFVMNPEFLREGLAVEDFMNPDRIVVGSYDKKSGDLFEPIYRGIDAPTVRTGLAAAEMIKYASNAFLATKISFSNEIGNVCKRLGIDVYQVMKGVGLDHRIGPHFLNAGAGFGGSCLPKDVAALIHLAKRLGEDPVLLRSAMEVNEQQPYRMVELLERRLGDLRGKRIAVLGLAFKDDTDDARESRSIPVIRELMRKGAMVAAHDPKANQSMARIIPEIQYCYSSSEALKDAEGCLVMTEWPQFGDLGPEFELMKNRLIIEGRRILTRADVEGICW